MFGIELTEIFILLRLVGIGVAGAAAFWGSVFVFLSRKAKKKQDAVLWSDAAQRLLWIFFPSLLFYSFMWIILAIKQCAFCVQAHEGISLVQTTGALTLSIQNQYPVFLLLVALGVLSFLALIFVRTFLFTHLVWLYVFSFLISSLLLFHSWGSFESARQSISFGLHNWHAILTIGSVIVIDSLYLMFRTHLQPLLGRIFLMFTVGIWIGLGLDFISSGLVFQEEFVLTDKFLFAQTLIGILIINGVFLAGPLARVLVAAKTRFSWRFNMIMGISGSISIVGWVGNGALDIFQSLTLSYWELFGFYIAFVFIAFLIHDMLERILQIQHIKVQD